MPTTNGTIKLCRLTGTANSVISSLSGVGGSDERRIKHRPYVAVVNTQNVPMEAITRRLSTLYSVDVHHLARLLEFKRKDRGFQQPDT